MSIEPTTAAAPTADAASTVSAGHRGRFVWYDLMTSDASAAIAFYTHVVGWGTEQWKDPAMPYTMWTVAGSPIGGVMPLPPHLVEAHVPPHWLAYIGTPDVADTCARAEALGGTVMMPPTEIPTVGHFAVLRDPQGATFAAFTSSTEYPASDAPPRVGDFSWHELSTSDHEAAFRFYSELFGWEKTGSFDMGPMGTYQMYGRSANGLPLGGMMNLTADSPMSPNWLLYARVEHLGSAIERARGAGGTLIHGPIEVPGGDVVAICTDPQGGAFALHMTKS